MKTISRLILHIFANALAILTAVWLVPNVVFDYNFINLVKIAVLLGLVNFFLKPIIKTITAPLIWLTLGLFTLVINIFLIWLVTYFAPELRIQGLNAFFWTMIIVSVLNYIVPFAIRDKQAQ